MELTGAGEMISTLETFFKFNDSVIRFMTVKIEKKKTIEKPSKDVKSDDKPQTVEVN
jgi:ribosomal protein S6